MDKFLIDVPMPSMGATVNELTVVSLKVQPGAQLTRGQKVAELESDKSVFEFESPCDGLLQAILAAPGDVKASGEPFLRIETADVSLKHLASSAPVPVSAKPAPGKSTAAEPPAIWTPRALKLAQEAGIDPATVTDIEATGPGRRVSGDDFARYLAKIRSRS
jgi:pyruvate/2-oxoglutarate dehydrogenase complex dihydrolipoamide acyltransferase (E2) component